MKFAFLLVLQFSLLNSNAMAHGNHGTAGLEHVLGHIAEHGLLFKSARLPSNEFVRLQDGTRFDLASNIQKSVEGLIDLTQEDDLTPVRRSVREILFKTDWNAVIRAVPGRTLDWSRDFGRDVSFTGARLFARHGILTAVLVVAAEVVEHVGGSVLTAGLSNAVPLCAFVQTGCVILSQPIKEYYWTVRDRFPQDQDLGERLKIQTATYRSRFRFWSTMRRVFLPDGQGEPTPKGRYKNFWARKTAIEKLILPTSFWARLRRKPATDVESLDEIFSCGHQHAFGYNCRPELPRSGKFRADSLDDTDEALVFLNPADQNLNELQRVTAAGEQTAYLKLILKLIEQGVGAAGVKYQTGLRLNLVVGRLEAAFDEYAFQLRQIAEAPAAASKNSERISNFIAGFYGIIRDLHQEVETAKSGADIREVPLLRAIEKLRAMGREFGQTGTCADQLG